MGFRTGEVNRRLNFVRRWQSRRLEFNSVIITSPESIVPKVNDDVTRLQTERRTPPLVLKLIDRPMFIGERPNFPDNVLG